MFVGAKCSFFGVDKCADKLQSLSNRFSCLTKNGLCLVMCFLVLDLWMSSYYCKKLLLLFSFSKKVRLSFICYLLFSHFPLAFVSNVVETTIERAIGNFLLEWSEERKRLLLWPSRKQFIFLNPKALGNPFKINIFLRWFWRSFL